MLVFMKHDTPEAAIRSLVIQLSREGIGAARAESAGRVLLPLPAYQRFTTKKAGVK